MPVVQCVGISASAESLNQSQLYVHRSSTAGATVSRSFADFDSDYMYGHSLGITKTILEGTSAHVGFCLAVKVDNPPEPANLLSGAEAALSNMKSPANPIALAIGASTSALEPVKDFIDNWTALLSKVQTFCELMDGIAEVRRSHAHPDGGILTYVLCQVHPYAKMAWSVISIPQKVFRLDLDDVSRDADQISCA